MGFHNNPLAKFIYCVIIAGGATVGVMGIFIPALAGIVASEANPWYGALGISIAFFVLIFDIGLIELFGAGEITGMSMWLADRLTWVRK
jgi:hypothetical protein